MLVADLLNVNRRSRPSARDVLMKPFIVSLMEHLSSRRELEAELMKLNIDPQMAANSGKATCNM